MDARIARIVSIGLIVIGVCAVVADVSLQFYWGLHGAATPSAEFPYPIITTINHHRHVGYVTATQNFFAHALFYLAFAAFGLRFLMRWLLKGTVPETSLKMNTATGFQILFLIFGAAELIAGLLPFCYPGPCSRYALGLLVASKTVYVLQGLILLYTAYAIRFRQRTFWVTGWYLIALYAGLQIVAGVGVLWKAGRLIPYGEIQALMTLGYAAVCAFAWFRSKEYFDR